MYYMCIGYVIIIGFRWYVLICLCFIFNGIATHRQALWCLEKPKLNHLVSKLIIKNHFLSLFFN